MVASSVLSYDLNLSELRPPLNQLRELDNMNDLMRSILEKGLLQPIIVRMINDKNYYEIVAGYRRYFACKKLGLKKIPCQIVDITDMEAFEISLVENVQRKTLNPIDEAKAFKKYVYENGWGSASQLATKLGKSVAYITKRIMLLDLPSEVTKAINENLLGPSIAEELFSIKQEDEKSKLAKLIIEKNMTINNVRIMVKEMMITDIDGSDESEIVMNKVGNNIRARSFERTIVSLKIAMNRIASIIDDVEDDWILYEMLMQHKRRLHEQIDILIKQRKKKFFIYSEI
ncbi:MAG TPA: ParB/RepB/Spo0J family partition protein [Nitrososphaeraceae archaeon]|jgi:ParB family transcriptional regulator, chromosome partitioning protein|nr:ParB/RepB/Spo0J family partition protein [Nitrososphaeraceae archaeon]